MKFGFGFAVVCGSLLLLHTQLNDAPPSQQVGYPIDDWLVSMVVTDRWSEISSRLIDDSFLRHQSRKKTSDSNFPFWS